MAQPSPRLRKILNQINSGIDERVVEGLVDLRGCEPPVFREYATLSPDVPELFAVWAGRVSAEGYRATRASVAVASCLVGVVTHAPQRSTAVTVARAVLDRHARFVHVFLGSDKRNPPRVALSLLTAIAARSPSLATEVLKALAFDSKSVQAVATARQDKFPKDIRTLYVRFVLTFLTCPDLSVVRFCVKGTKYAESILRHIANDNPALATEILDAVTALKPNLQAILLHPRVIDSLARHGVRSSGPVGQLLCDFTATLARTAPFVSTKHVVRLVANLSPVDNNAHRATWLAVAAARPEAVELLLGALTGSLDPRPSSKWIANVLLVQELVQAWTVGADADKLTIPSVITRGGLTHGLQHANPLVRVATVFLMQIVLERVTLDTASARDAAKTHLPSVQALVTLRQQNRSEGTPLQALLHQRSLALLAIYCGRLPDLFAEANLAPEKVFVECVASNPSPLTLYNAISLLAAGPPERARLLDPAPLLLCLLQLLFCPFPALRDAARTHVLRALRASVIFEPCPDEAHVWLDELDSRDAAIFLDKTLRRALDRPDISFSALKKKRKHGDDDDDGGAPVSGLFAAAFLAPAAEAPPPQDYLVRVAQALLGQTAHRDGVADLLECDASALSAESKATVRDVAAFLRGDSAAVHGARNPVCQALAAFIVESDPAHLDGLFRREIAPGTLCAFLLAHMTAARRLAPAVLPALVQAVVRCVDSDHALAATVLAHPCVLALAANPDSEEQLYLVAELCCHPAATVRGNGDVQPILAVLVESAECEIQAQTLCVLHALLPPNTRLALAERLLSTVPLASLSPRTPVYQLVLRLLGGAQGARGNITPGLLSKLVELALQQHKAPSDALDGAILHILQQSGLGHTPFDAYAHITARHLDLVEQFALHPTPCRVEMVTLLVARSHSARASLARMSPKDLDLVATLAIGAEHVRAAPTSKLAKAYLAAALGAMDSDGAGDAAAAVVCAALAACSRLAESQQTRIAEALRKALGKDPVRAHTMAADAIATGAVLSVDDYFGAVMPRLGDPAVAGDASVMDFVAEQWRSGAVRAEAEVVGRLAETALDKLSLCAAMRALHFGLQACPETDSNGDIGAAILAHGRFREAMLGADEGLRLWVVLVLAGSLTRQPGRCAKEQFAVLAGAYTATCSEVDYALRHILTIYEQHEVLLEDLGYRWGGVVRRALEEDDVAHLGRRTSAQTAYSEMLDSAELARSCQALRGSIEASERDYDPVFVLGFWIFETRSPQVNIKNLIQFGGLAYAVSALSCEENEVRVLGYEVLAGILKQVHEVSFSERRQILLLLNALRNTVREEHQQLSCTLTAFVCAAIPVMFDPRHPVYRALNKFLLERPFIDQHGIPMLSTTFESPRPTFRKERTWILRVLAQSIAREDDMRHVRHQRVLEQLLGFVDSPLADGGARDLVFDVLDAMARVPVAAYHAVHRCGLADWIVSRKPIGQRSVALLGRLLAGPGEVGAWTRAIVQRATHVLLPVPGGLQLLARAWAGEDALAGDVHIGADAALGAIARALAEPSLGQALLTVVVRVAVVGASAKQQQTIIEWAAAECCLHQEDEGTFVAWMLRALLADPALEIGQQTTAQLCALLRRAPRAGTYVVALNALLALVLSKRPGRVAKGHARLFEAVAHPLDVVMGRVREGSDSDLELGDRLAEALCASG